MKIALWLEKNWAFGRIANAIKKYSKHEIDIYHWQVPLDDFSKYDLLYTPVWFAKEIYQRFANNIPIVIGMMGVAELFNYDPITLQPCQTEKNIIESGRISEVLKNILNQQKIIGCVSRELVNLLRPQIDCPLAYTPCGVDLDDFYLTVQNGPLTVLCPAAPDQFIRIQHGYDVKRFKLVKEIQKRLPDVEFKFLTRKLSLDEMPAFYRTGNVLIYTSHSEGTPLPILEAGAMGVIPLSTPVGVVPELVIPNVNGELLIGNIVEHAVEILSDWKNRSLTRMQQNIQETVISRSWPNLIDTWDAFFDLSL